MFSDKKTDDASINSDQLEHIEQMLLTLATSIKVSVLASI